MVEASVVPVGWWGIVVADNQKSALRGAKALFWSIDILPVMLTVGQRNSSGIIPMGAAVMRGRIKIPGLDADSGRGEMKLICHRRAPVAGLALRRGFSWEEVVRTRNTVTLAMLAGFALGAAAIQTLHAQGKPPVYVVTEIDVTNVEAYTKEYIPVVRPVIQKTGGKLLAASQKVTMLEGTPQNSRVVINVFDTLEKAQAQRDNPEYKEARKLGDKYAKFRAYVVEGLPQ
jgi:uncharacterized protein (DUF1330 family)